MSTVLEKQNIVTFEAKPNQDQTPDADDIALMRRSIDIDELNITTPEQVQALIAMTGGVRHS